MGQLSLHAKGLLYWSHKTNYDKYGRAHPNADVMTWIAHGTHLQSLTFFCSIWTNAFGNLNKYIWQFEQIHLAIWTNTCAKRRRGSGLLTATILEREEAGGTGRETVGDWVKQCQNMWEANVWSTRSYFLNEDFSDCDDNCMVLM